MVISYPHILENMIFRGVLFVVTDKVRTWRELYLRKECISFFKRKVRTMKHKTETKSEFGRRCFGLTKFDQPEGETPFKWSLRHCLVPVRGVSITEYNGYSTRLFSVF